MGIYPELWFTMWQPSANLGRDAKWHGQDGGIGSPGFVVLSSIPIGPLKLVTYKGSIQVHTCIAWPV